MSLRDRTSQLKIQPAGCNKDEMWRRIQLGQSCVIAARVAIILVITVMSHLQFWSILSRSKVTFIQCFFFTESVDVCFLFFKMLHTGMRFTLMIRSTNLVFTRNLSDLIYCSTIVTASLYEPLAIQRTVFNIHVRTYVRTTTAVKYHSLTG